VAATAAFTNDAGKETVISQRRLQLVDVRLVVFDVII